MRSQHRCSLAFFLRRKKGVQPLLAILHNRLVRLVSRRGSGGGIRITNFAAYRSEKIKTFNNRLRQLQIQDLGNFLEDVCRHGAWAGRREKDTLLRSNSSGRYISKALFCAGRRGACAGHLGERRNFDVFNGLIQDMRSWSVLRGEHGRGDLDGRVGCLLLGQRHKNVHGFSSFGGVFVSSLFVTLLKGP